MTPSKRYHGFPARAVLLLVCVLQALSWVNANSMISQAAEVAVSCVPVQEILPNGLRLIVLEDHSFPVVSCQVWYRVGARNERMGSTGLSHLVEHLLFGNIGSFKKGEVGATIARNGGQFNGFTSDDFTAFFESLPSSKLELALRVESERMRGAKFSALAVRDEIVNIQTEFDNQQKDPADILSKEVRIAAYQQHPYHNPTIGWKSDIANLTAQDARSYYDQYYRPDNATMVIVGDVKGAIASQLVKKYFAGVPKPDVPVPVVASVEPPQKGERRVTIKQTGKQEYVDIAYHAPAIGDVDAPAMSVLEKLLNATSSSRLKTRLIDQKTCLTAGSYFEAKKDPGLFTITCTVAGVRPRKVMDSIEALLSELKNQPVPESELKRARNQAEFAYLSDRDGPYHSAFEMGYFDSLLGWQNSYSWASRLHAVSAADIQRVARKYLFDDNRVIGWAPSPNAPRPVDAKSPSSGDQPPAKIPSEEAMLHNQLLGFKTNNWAVAPKPPLALDYRSQRFPAQMAPIIAAAPAVMGDSTDSEPAPCAVTFGASAMSPASPASTDGTTSTAPAARVARVASTTTVAAAPGATNGTTTTTPAALPAMNGMVTTAPAVNPSTKGTTSTTPAARAAGNGSTASMPATPGGAASKVASPTAIPNVLPPMPFSTELEQSIGKLSNIQQRVLKNGIRLVVLESHLTPVVQMLGCVNAGAAFDPPGKKGISELTAAVLNEGPGKHNRSQLQSMQEDIGLPPNAMLKFESGPEVMGFETRFLSRDIAQQSTNLIDILSAAAETDADLEKAKSDAASNLKHAEDQPAIRVYRALMQSLLSETSSFYPGQPAERLKNIAAFTQADLKSFREQRLRPDATTIVLTGDVNINQAAALIEKISVGWSGKAGAKKLNTQLSERRILRISIPIKDKSQSLVCVGQLMQIPHHHPDFGPLLLADCALTNHPLMSRMGVAINNEPSLAQVLDSDDMGSKLEPLAGLTAWSVAFSIPTDAVSNVVNTLNNESRRLVKSGLTAEELNETKRYLLGALPLKYFGDSAAAGKSMLELMISGTDPDYLPRILSNVKATDLESVNKFIRTTFKPDQATLVVAGNIQSARAGHKPSPVAPTGKQNTAAGAHQSTH